MKNEQNISFDALYRKYYPRLASYAAFFLKNDEAHDVVQEVFLELLKKENDQLKESTLNALLYKSVQNKCVDTIRHRKVIEQYASDVGKQLLQMELDLFYSSRNEVEEALLSKELQEQIDAAVETLPARGKEIFKLYFEHRKTAKEIASILEISRSTVENHIYNSVQALREKLADYRK